MSAKRAWILCGLSVAIFLWGAGSARAQEKRVGLASDDASMLRALQVALVPWRLQVVALPNPPPGTTMPAAATRARALVDELGLHALVWLGHDESGFALWVYDRENDRALARRLPHGAPFDPAAAAAVALSVKTFLRASFLAPPTQRFGAAAASSRRLGILRFHSGVGLRLLRGLGAEPRFGVDASVWPQLLAGRVGLGLGVTSGPGYAVDEALFVGRFTSVQLSLKGWVQKDVSSRVHVQAGLGATLDMTGLSGAAPVHDVIVQLSRTNPALDLGARAGFRITPQALVGVWLGGSYALRRQRYLVQGDPVLSIPAFALRLGVTLSITVF